jgi:hypothetical protein
MKTRTGFVSNSSSSSFVIIDADDGHVTLAGEMAFGHKGTTEFGWGPGVANDVHSRINFAYLQTHYSGQHLDMLEDVIKEHTGLDDSIVWEISTDWNDNNWGYIDHQSSAVEGENMEIFDNKDKLKDFLFGKGSYIHLDNDNH